MRKIVSHDPQQNEPTVFRVLCFWAYSWNNGVVARKIGQLLSANSNSIFSAIWSQILCGHFSSGENHLFSEPGPINDHCPVPNFFANMETTFAFARHYSSLPFLSQEMSFNIDINKILPVKVSVSGVSPNLLNRSVTLAQNCTVVNPGKLFHSNSVGSPCFLHSLCSFHQLWSILSWPSKLLWTADVDGPFQDNTESEKT